MITKAHRFHGYGSLRRTYEQGRTVRSPHLALRFTQNQRRSTWRCAVVVSKKVSKSAVTRNRIRRRVYETVRKEANTIKGPVDLVFTVYSEQIEDLSPRQLEKVIQNLLSQADLTDTTLRDMIEPKER